MLALVWIGLAIAIGREFNRKAAENAINVAPEVGRPIPDVTCHAGRPVEHHVPEDAFVDADPGDVLHLAARLADGRPLPPWLRFDAKHRRFSGQAPTAFAEELTITVVASDVDGLEASSSFRLRAVSMRSA
jgi:hypothetical protein